MPEWTTLGSEPDTLIEVAAEEAGSHDLWLLQLLVVVLMILDFWFVDWTRSRFTINFGTLDTTTKYSTSLRLYPLDGAPPFSSSSDAVFVVSTRISLLCILVCAVSDSMDALWPINRYNNELVRLKPFNFDTDGNKFVQSKRKSISPTT
eukprot:CCRYP_011905-RA/>CCRYP_011905-RA protein AED:0.35 eAED:0.39 QI:0/0.5/0/1/0/0/3/0/148